MTIRFDFKIEEVEDIIKRHIVRTYPDLDGVGDITVELSTYSTTRVNISTDKEEE